MYNKLYLYIVIALSLRADRHSVGRYELEDVVSDSHQPAGPMIVAVSGWVRMAQSVTVMHALSFEIC